MPDLVVSGNNRGHDFGSRVRRNDGDVVLGGGGWERFDESPRRSRSWISFAASLGFERVALLGHSLRQRSRSCTIRLSGKIRASRVSWQRRRRCAPGASIRSSSR